MNDDYLINVIDTYLDNMKPLMKQLPRRIEDAKIRRKLHRIGARNKPYRCTGRWWRSDNLRKLVRTVRLKLSIRFNASEQKTWQ